MTLGTLPDALITRCAWCDRYDVGGRWLPKEDVAAFLRDDGSTARTPRPLLMKDIRQLDGDGSVFGHFGKTFLLATPLGFRRRRSRNASFLVQRADDSPDDVSEAGMLASR